MEIYHMRSKVDWWVGALLLFSLGIMGFTLVTVPENERLIGYGVGVPTFAFITWILLGTYYELREEILYCRCGPFVEKIRYENIASIKLANGLLSSMALSSKRIEIRQKGKGFITGTTYISPLKREAFYDELKKRCHL